MNKFLRKLDGVRDSIYYYDLKEFATSLGKDIGKIPFSIRALIENSLYHGGIEDAEKLLDWQDHIGESVEFLPTRIVCQDFTGVPCVVDIASLREAVQKQGVDVKKVNPVVPVDLVIDHSVQVDDYGRSNSLKINTAKEFERNQERYSFLKWAGKNFSNFRIIPPETGIIHQVNLEYLSKGIDQKQEKGLQLVAGETIFGTDSHTTMINALGVLGWGVGGIEAEAAMLGISSLVQIPEVVGVELTGQLDLGANATDLALTVTQKLREVNVVGKFVEYFGDGYKKLSIEDRATIANMAPEYGATCGFCPIDEATKDYLSLTGRVDSVLELFEAHALENSLFYSETPAPQYSQWIQIDLSTIRPSISGPKRPQDRSDIENFSRQIRASESSEVSQLPKQEEVQSPSKEEVPEISAGDVVLAAITSCTNTSNPYLMIQAGLLAKKSFEKGLTVHSRVKTSLAPGSKVATAYLEQLGLLPYLEKLGFQIVGYGCTTCIGNSGPLESGVTEVLEEKKIEVSSVLSGNRNFEGRIHPLIPSNYLTSPMMVVAFALFGNTVKDIFTEPLGTSEDGEAVYLNDVLPDHSEIKEAMEAVLSPQLFRKNYAHIMEENEDWNKIPVIESSTFEWEESSTYIKNPPYFDEDGKSALTDWKKMVVLAKLGDSVTTDHISPAGAIPLHSPAGIYLSEHGVRAELFNSYGARRGNHHIMMRGTLANVRVQNQLVSCTGGFTKNHLTGAVETIFETSEEYRNRGISSIVLAGKDYGMGSSRDWAAKGVQLLGVKAVIAESFERIHRSNLIMMGVVPLVYQNGETAETLGLTGEETFEIVLPEKLGLRETYKVIATDGSGKEKSFSVTGRIDSTIELEYFNEGGILKRVAKKIILEEKNGENTNAK
ncbi:MAG: aconitate hydratase AcnA [Streptococcaceae bacterium]|jgi:aconitate hydratase|nr:aconitate hydratase AcnA [Streptococcaceae bacterium]